MRTVIPFHIHLSGDETGKTYIGEFGVKPKLTHRDILQRDQIRRELLGPSADGASSDALSRAKVFAELRTRLVEYPDWWAACGFGLDLIDQNVIVTLYEKCLAIETEERNKTIAEGEAATAELRRE